MFAKRLFDMMTSDQGIKISSQNDSYNEGEDEDESNLEKVIEKKKFEDVLLMIYFGTTEE
jgi:hypothetical protein